MSNSYEIKILKEDYEHLILLIAAAIDFVKTEEAAATQNNNS